MKIDQMLKSYNKFQYTLEDQYHVEYAWCTSYLNQKKKNL